MMLYLIPMKTYLSLLSVCLSVASPSSALGQAESAAAAEGAGGQELRELHPGKFVTGTITVKMEGGTQVFLATSQQLAANLGGNIADPAAKAFAQKVAGRSVDTAVVRLIGGSLYVTLDGYSNIDPAVPVAEGVKSGNFTITLVLDPKTLKVKADECSLSYHAPGADVRDSRETAECEIVLNSVKKAGDGALSMEGSFTGRLVKNMAGEPLADPEAVSGTFEIQRATGDDLLGELIGR